MWLVGVAIVSMSEALYQACASVYVCLSLPLERGFPSIRWSRRRD